jgi:hypothetical protein
MADKEVEKKYLIREIEIATMRKLFTKKVTKEGVEFDELSFRFWIEANNQQRHDEWLQGIKETQRLNNQIVESNKKITELNERYIKVLEKVEKHLSKLVAKK